MTDAVTLLARKISQSGVVAAVSNLGDRGGLFEPPQGYERGVIAKMFTGLKIMKRT